MIELRTGVPGAGKTLSMVQALFDLFERWGKYPEELRPVFVHGIPDLAFPVATLPLKQAQIVKGQTVLVPDWEAVPDGSLVLIDEAQGNPENYLFPPRSSAVAAPAHVAWLNTHRHHGVDIWLTTQHPKLIDSTVRALVGKHIHFRRLFGSSKVVSYEWDACSDNISGLKNATMRPWAFPKNVFKFYKSAEIHTKQKFKLPLWIYIPLIGFIMGIVFIPKAYSVMFGTHKTASDYGAVGSIQKPASEAKGGALAPPEHSLNGFPAVSSAPSVSAPVVSASVSKSDRPIEKLRISPGVYGDDASQPAHYSAADLQRQAVAVAILDRHEEEYRYNRLLASYEPVRQIRYVPPVEMLANRD